MIKNSSDDPETRQVAACLQSLARREHPRLPAASQVWWRASIIRRLVEDEAAVQRAERPALWSQVIGLAFSVFVIFLAVSAGLLMNEHSAAGPEMLVLTLIMILLLPLVPVAGLVAMLFAQS